MNDNNWVRSQDSQKGGYIDYLCRHVHEYKNAGLGGSVGMLPLGIRCSETASEAVLGRSRAVVATLSAEYCIQFLAVFHPCVDTC